MPAIAHAAPPDDRLAGATDAELQKILNGLDLGDWQKLLDESAPTNQSFNLLQSLSAMARGEFTLTLDQLFDLLPATASKALASQQALLAQLLILVVMAAMLGRLSDAFEKSGSGSTAKLLIYSLASLMILKSLFSTLQQTQQAIGAILTLSQSIFPVLTTLLALNGGFLSSALLTPAYSTAIEIGSSIILNMLVPLALVSGSLSVAGCITGKDLLEGLGSLIKSGCIWTLSIILTVITGFTAMQGISASTYDGISMRTAKYAVDNAVPYVGGMLSDMADTLLGSAVLVKNAVGMAGLLTLFYIILTPLFTLLCSVLAFRLASAVSSVFGGELCSMTNAAAKTITLYIALLLGSSMLLMVMMGIAVSAGNGILYAR